ncbi:hypothetical protein RUND412_006215 [Rhizina undulata]
MPPLTNLDLINNADSFLNPATHPHLHAEQLASLHLFTHDSYILGYILPFVFTALADRTLSGDHWIISGKNVSLVGSTVEERSENIRKTVESWRDQKLFTILKGWRNELYSVYSPPGKLFLNVERSAAALFGVVTYGVHMTAYLLSPLRIWTPRRNPAKPTYGGLLDNTVAGGISAGMGVFETLIKESEEEASFPESLIREKSTAVGAISYFYRRQKSAGGEEGLLQPEIEYCYDLEVGEDVVPTPGDDEVQEFQLWGVDKIKEELAKGNFKPNCALVLIDFFIRHGVITPENEPDYIEIVSRLHRRFEFPTR